MLCLQANVQKNGRSQRGNDVRDERFGNPHACVKVQRLHLLLKYENAKRYGAILPEGRLLKGNNLELFFWVARCENKAIFELNLILVHFLTFDQAIIDLLNTQGIDSEPTQVDIVTEDNGDYYKGCTFGDVISGTNNWLEITCSDDNDDRIPTPTVGFALF